MNEHTPSPEVILRRLERLERENRWMRQALVLVPALATIFVVAGSEARAPRVVEAERFVLLDAQGRARVTIGTPRTSGVAIDLGPDEPAIWISDGNGQDRVALTTDGLRLVNSKGRPAGSLEFVAGEGTRLVLNNKDGKVLSSLPK